MRRRGCGTRRAGNRFHNLCGTAIRSQLRSSVPMARAWSPARFSPFVRPSPGTPPRHRYRYQHFYAFFAYGLAMLFWVFVKDYRYFLRRDLGPHRKRHKPPGEIAMFAATKLFPHGGKILLPLMVLRLPWVQFLLPLP